HPGVMPAITEMQSRGTVGMARNDPERNAQSPPAILQIHLNRSALVDHRVALAIVPAGVARRLRTDEQHVVPHDFRLRLRQLLQPGVVRETAVVDRRIGTETELDAGGRWPVDGCGDTR